MKRIIFIALCSFVFFSGCVSDLASFAIGQASLYVANEAINAIDDSNKKIDEEKRKSQ